MCQSTQPVPWPVHSSKTIYVFLPRLKVTVWHVKWRTPSFVFISLFFLSFFFYCVLFIQPFDSWCVFIVSGCGIEFGLCYGFCLKGCGQTKAWLPHDCFYWILYITVILSPSTKACLLRKFKQTIKNHVLSIGVNKKHTVIHNILYVFFSINQLDLSGHGCSNNGTNYL